MIITTLSGSDSNSYATLAEATAYHALRENTAWADADESAQNAALIRATDFIDAGYIFRSVPATDEQALENPRFGQEELHPRLVNATIALALHMLTDNPATATPTAEIASESKSMDGLGSTSTTYREKPRDPYPEITKMLSLLANRRGAAASNMVMK